MVIHVRKPCCTLGIIGVLYAYHFLRAGCAMKNRVFSCNHAAPEMVDVLNKAGGPTGRTVSRQEAHQKSILHGVVRACILDSAGANILLQKRAPSMVDYGGKWALTAGHIQAGETASQSLVREIQEEIGVPLTDTNFFHQGLRGEIGSGAFPVHHIVHHYIVVLPRDVILAPQEEVLELKFIKVRRVLKTPKVFFGGELTQFYRSDLAYLQQFFL